MTKKASNALFTDFQALAYEALRTWHRADDADYVRAILMKDRDAIAGRLFREFVGGASASAGNPKQAQAILYRVTTYAADQWDPSKCSLRAGRDVGACAEAVAGVDGTSARQAVGSRHTHAARRSRSADAIREAIEAARAAGEAITVSGIARRSGMDRKTVRANWPSGESAA